MARDEYKKVTGGNETTYLDAETRRLLWQYSEDNELKTNAVIKQAVKEFLERKGMSRSME